MAKENKTGKNAQGTGGTSVKNAGFGIKPPSASCTDSKCPFHGDLKVRGRVFEGVVIRSRAQKTAIVSWGRKHLIPKYERYEKRRTKLHVHNPPCINSKEGDIVQIMECRPLSKTKKFVIVQKIGEEIVNIAEDAYAKAPAEKTDKEGADKKERKETEKMKEKQAKSGEAA